MRIYSLFQLLIFSIVFSTIRHDNSISGLAPKKNTEDVLIEKIFHLTEIRQLDKELKRKIGAKANVTILTNSTPTKENLYYNFSVGYNGPDRFETRYNFQINESDISKKDFEKYLKVWEPISGNYISLDKFRLTKRY